MFRRFSFKQNNLVAFLCVAYLGAANATAPIIVNNAEVTNNYSAYGVHQNEDVTTSLGLASDINAVQQSLIIDKDNVQYSAYKSTDDDRIYVLKFVNNRWVSAADGNGDDGLAITVGDVAPLLDGSTGPATDSREHTIYSKTVLLATGANGEIYLGYLDEVGGTDDVEGDNSLHVFELTTADNVSSWQLLTSLKLSGEDSFDGFDVDVHDMELEVDSLGNIYAAFNSYRPNATPSGGARHFAGLTKVVKYTKNDNTWNTMGEAYTAVVTHMAGNNRFFPSSLAISANDDIYYAYNEYIDTIDGSNMSLRVVKFDDAAGVWNEVGDAEQRHVLIMNDATTVVHRATSTLDLAVSPSGKLFLAATAWSKFLTVTTFDPFEEVREGEQPIWKIAFPTNGGVQLDQISQSSRQRNVRIPLDLSIVVGSDDVPYVAYGENGFFRDIPSKSVVVLGIVDELNNDNEIVSNWVPLNVPLAEATSAESSASTPRYINIVLGANNRPHLLYRDESGNDFSRSLRANVTNTSEVIELSMTEEQFDAGQVSLEIADFGEPSMFANYTFGGRHLDDFVASDLANGKLTLAQEGDFLVGANINFPFLLLDVFATDIATSEVSHVEPVQVRVSFEPSDDPDVQAKRGFAFAAFLCGDIPSECTININEDDPILFDFIQSKIANHTVVGDSLPDGVTFDAADPFASFEGKPSFTSTAGIGDVASFNFSVTANPIDGSLNNGTDVMATPITIDMTVNVTNTPINVEANYVQTINENDFLSVAPTVSIAAESFDVVWDESNTNADGEVDPTLGTDFSWLKFNRLTGELTGQSRFVHAGIYRGTIFASGFDNGETLEGGTDNRLAFEVEIVVTNVPMSWSAPSEVSYTLEENENFTGSFRNEAVQFFFIKEANSLPDFITLDLTTGDLVFLPDFEDESEEPYTFTIVAEGWDEGEVQETVFSTFVNHRNAPPSLERVVGVETEGEFPVFIDILTPAFDVDEPGNLVSYDGEVFMVFEDDPLYGTEVRDSENVLIRVENIHTGFGDLEVVSNGFVYTPSVDDPAGVLITYVVKDDLGLYQQGEVAVRVNVIQDVSFDQKSEAGSMAHLLGLFAFMCVIRVYKRKA